MCKSVEDYLCCPEKVILCCCCCCCFVFLVLCFNFSLNVGGGQGWRSASITAFCERDADKDQMQSGGCQICQLRRNLSRPWLLLSASHYCHRLSFSRTLLLPVCVCVCVHARHICVRLVWMPRAYFIDTTIFKLVVWEAPVLTFIQYLPVRCNKIVSSYFASIILSSNDGTDMAGYGPIYANFIIIKYGQVAFVGLMDHRKLLATIKLGRPVWLALSHFTTVCLRASFGVSRGRLTPTMTEEEQVGKHNGID